MDDLGILIYEAMKDGNKGRSENEFYKVKIVGTKEEENGISCFIMKKVKIKFKESGLKVSIPFELFLTNNELDDSSISLLGRAIQILYIPSSVCSLF